MTIPLSSSGAVCFSVLPCLENLSIFHLALSGVKGLKRKGNPVDGSRNWLRSTAMKERSKCCIRTTMESKVNYQPQANTDIICTLVRYRNLNTVSCLNQQRRVTKNGDNKNNIAEFCNLERMPINRCHNYLRHTNDSTTNKTTLPNTKGNYQSQGQ